MVDLVHEGVLPPDDVTLRPPPFQEWVVSLGDQHLSEPLSVGARGGVDEVDLELIQPLEVERDRALGPVDLEAERVPPPAAETRRLERPDRPAFELDRRLERIVDVDRPTRPLGDERPRE